MNRQRQAWAVMLVAFLAGIAVTINQFKVPPVLPDVMSDLNVGVVTGGWLMSVFAVAAVLLSIPAAFFVSRVGPRISGTLALGCVVTGSLLGAMAPSATVLLIGRAVEGISVGLIAVLAPTLISLWFPPQKRGIPMGIWAAWVPAGSLIAFNLTHLLTDPFGWRAAWWFGALLALAVLVLFWWVVRVPAGREDQPAVDSLTPGAAIAFLAHPAIWLLPLAFGTFTFGLIGYSTWAPSFLTETLSVGAGRANFYASLIFLAGLVSNIAGGWAINVVRPRQLLLTGSLLGAGLLYLASFRLGSVAQVVPYMLALGFISNVVPTAAFTLTPESVPDPKLTELALAALNVVSNLGVLLGPPLIGAWVSTGNWAWSSIFLALVTGAGLVVSLVVWRWMSQNSRSRPELTPDTGS